MQNEQTKKSWLILGGRAMAAAGFCQWELCSRLHQSLVRSAWARRDHAALLRTQKSYNPSWQYQTEKRWLSAQNWLNSMAVFLSPQQSLGHGPRCISSFRNKSCSWHWITGLSPIHFWNSRFISLHLTRFLHCPGDLFVAGWSYSLRPLSWATSSYAH